MTKNQVIQRIERRAKYILLELEQGLISIHLRMTGKVFCEESSEEQKKHTHCRIKFKTGESLRFQDVRKFGRVCFHKNRNEIDDKLGIEPLSHEFTLASLKELILNKKRLIKPLLLDQSVIAGLGNIYVDEALWYAKINPSENSQSLTDKQISALFKAIPNILKKSIELNGTSFQTFYYGKGKKGNFVNLLKVFGKQGKNCTRCRSKILKTRVAQRGTHYCPKCQGLN